MVGQERLILGFSSNKSLLVKGVAMTLAAKPFDKIFASRI